MGNICYGHKKTEKEDELEYLFESRLAPEVIKSEEKPSPPLTQV